jgi:hypothetical protein
MYVRFIAIWQKVGGVCVQCRQTTLLKEFAIESVICTKNAIWYFAQMLLYFTSFEH